MASYNLDFTRRPSSWLRYLGRHQAAVFMEHSDSQGWSSNNNLFNVTPLATTGAAATINNGANLLQYRYYFDPARGKVGTAAGKTFLTYPVLYAGDPLPARDPSGVTPGYVSQQGTSASESVVTTRALATQSFFWNDRIVVTNGLRHDIQTGWTAAPADFNPLRDANGFAPRGTGVDLRAFKPSSRLSRGGHTYSRGLVVHALPWLSLSYNTSNNFQVNAAGKDIYGDLLPNPNGEGKDYGLKFAFFDRKLFFDVTYYTNSSVNASDSISSNAAGNFKQVDDVWNAIAVFTGDNKYRTYPYASTATTWADVVSTTSKGWEFALTANPSKQWRASLNGSVRGNNTTSTRGTIVAKYFAEYLPFIKSHPEWQSQPANGSTVALRVADIENTLVNFAAIKNSPSSNFAAKWTLNLVQSYDFSREAKLAGLPLGGVSLGGSMNARGKAINGFAVDSKLILDPTVPFYSPAYANFGAWITYKRKIFKNRIDWRLQLNVRNVLDQNTIYPLIDVDTRDGKHTPATAVYTLKEPRTYQFTSAFRF
jgi:iron complex outermembrane recepter protein